MFICFLCRILNAPDGLCPHKDYLLINKNQRKMNEVFKLKKEKAFWFIMNYSIEIFRNIDSSVIDINPSCVKTAKFLWKYEICIFISSFIAFFHLILNANYFGGRIINNFPLWIEDSEELLIFNTNLIPFV